MEQKRYVPSRFNAVNFKDLYVRVYERSDQRHMKAHTWDYENPRLLINRIYKAVCAVKLSELSEEDAEWREELLWFWNHHAISCAIWRYGDLQAARKYAAVALSHQFRGHPNKITKLFALLLDSKLAQAKRLSKTVHPDEKEAADMLLEAYAVNWNLHPTVS